jgi:hypothetical protein
MTYVEKLLSRFEGVTQVDEGQWEAKSPLRDDEHPSVRISLAADGKLLLRDFGGARTRDLLKAVGLDFRACYPPVDETPVEGIVGNKSATRATDVPAVVAPVHHHLYTEFLSRLGLNDAHSVQLRQRGARVDWFKLHGYRSLSWLAVRRAIKDLQEIHPALGAELLHTPGFRRGMVNPNVIETVFSTGLTIPVRSPTGEIIALQVRQDTGPAKYHWFGGAGSPPTGTPAHTTSDELFHTEIDDAIWVTEGPMKADLLAQFRGVRAIGIPGVSTWKSALAPLANFDLNTSVVLAWDADWRTNTSVAFSLFEMGEDLVRRGWDVWLATWPGQWKGIDDFLRENANVALSPWKEGKVEVQKAMTQKHGGTTVVPTAYGTMEM